MQDPNSLSRSQLLKLLEQQAAQLASRDDMIGQLEAKLQRLERDYLKLWRERFAAKSERYINDADQLRLDFGDTDEAADAAAGLAEAVEEADLIPAHKRPLASQVTVVRLPSWFTAALSRPFAS
jgi:uncharacterized protein (DUF3084 family)